MKFSEKMEEIETIVTRLEKEALPLEDALSLFENGVGLIRECRMYLDEAKEKVMLLSSNEGEIPFPSTATEEKESVE